jgi:membrane protease YdiL (CAAX protease family)
VKLQLAAANMLPLALLIPAPTLGVLAAMAVVPGTPGRVMWIASKIWLAAFPAVWWLGIEHGRPSTSAPRRGGLGLGLATGLGITATILLAFALAGGLVDTTAMRAAAAKTGLTNPALYLAGSVYWVTVNSLVEEYVWRWFVYSRCEALAQSRAWPRWCAVLASALLFTVHHTVALSLQTGWVVTLLGSLGVLAAGAVWSWLYLRTRSIWPGYLSHALADIAVFAVGAAIIFGK